MFKTILKALAALLAILFVLLIFAVKFSTVESRYECKSTITFNGTTRPAVVYLKITEARWWARLWSDSDGDMNLEIPNEFVDYFSHIKEVGDQLQIFDHRGNLVGTYSSLSGALMLKTTRGLIEGKCVRIEKN
jgi:hypothetical protein